MSLIKKLLFEYSEQGKYYRAEGEFIGKEVKYEPKGFYEAIDDDGGLVPTYGGYHRSTIKELSASKYVGGAVIGSYSMREGTDTFYIYEIDKKPHIDISHYTQDDFEYIEEVRYRENVIGKYIGKVILDKELKDTIDAFYEVSTHDFDPDELDIPDNIWDNLRELKEMLKKIKPK